jgi:two-component system, cell cycle sensor histidine kinase and response regulator CckA
LETSGNAAGVRVRVDPGQFEQVVMNLAINARDAMPAGGTLRIDTSRVELDAVAATQLQLAPGSYVAVSVTDSGMGMDDTVRARIFEPFFTTKPPGAGTGLGLSTVYGILQQSGGSIAVESRVNEGSTFTVFLPLAVAIAETPRPSSSPPPRRLGNLKGTVLVAEDEESVRTFMCTVLSSEGFQVLEAASGIEAAHLVEALAQAIDLLITDVVMPGMVGPDLAHLTLARFPQTRVLYITGYATHPAIPPGFMNDDDALLQKPFSPEQFLARVHERLGIGA